MKLTHVTVASVCVGMMLSTCQKDQKAFCGKQPAPATEKSGGIAFPGVVEADYTQYFQIDPQTGGSVQGSQGTEIVIGAGALRTATGGQISGLVTVTLVEVYDNSDRILLNMTTETEANTTGTGGVPLTSGGSFIVTMKTSTGGTVTAPSGGITVLVPGSNTGGANSNMTLWAAVPSADQTGDIAWQETSATLSVLSGGTYSFPIQPTAFFNVDVWDWELAGPFAPIPLRVSMPSGFDEEGTEIYIQFDDNPNTLTSLDVYVPASGTMSQYWTENTPYFEIGKTGHIIAVSVVDDVLYSEIKAFTIGEDHFESLTNLTETDWPTLEGLIDGL